MIRRRVSFDQSKVRLDFDNLPLYGREKEQEVLSECQRGVCLGDTSLVLMSGCSGKTELVENMLQQQQQQMVVRANFVSCGEFSEPYAAIVDGISKYLSNNKVSSRLLKKTLGKDRAMMTRVIPKLEDLLGACKPQQQQPVANNVHAFSSFIQVFCKFTRALACNDGAFIFFFDDLQWYVFYQSLIFFVNQLFFINFVNSLHDTGPTKAPLN